jgi:5-methyltetrahydropteroyltriglutamate--homocysteine methyltransferase
VLRSGSRILTTHVGSLPRPQRLKDALLGRQDGTSGRAEVVAVLPGAVRELVEAQLNAGVDVVSDGEAAKPSFTGYVRYRLDGLDGASTFPEFHDLNEFLGIQGLNSPEMAEAVKNAALPRAVGPLRYVGQAELREDIETFTQTIEQLDVTEAFMAAASPGMLAFHIENDHYPSYEAYVGALAETMREEYEAIADAGLILQLDCPDLPLTCVDTTRFWASDVVERMGHKAFVDLNIEALNTATRNIDPDRMRMHICWGNAESTHMRDVPLADVMPVILRRARPNGVSFEAANPRHAHEWALFADLDVPDDKVLLPGLVDTTTGYVEHPELIAQRIRRFADLVGRERVIASTDCGFSTIVGHDGASGGVSERIAWLKLQALRDGADLV